MKKKKSTRQSSFDIGFDIVSTILLVIALMIVLYPLYFVVIASISDANSISLGKVILLPKNVDFVGYRRILEDNRILDGYGNSIIYTIASTVIGTITTIMAGYSLPDPILSAEKR